MDTTTRRSLCTMLLLACSGGAIAQSEEDADLALAFGDKSFVSIATGSKQTLRRAPAVATVITAEDIAAMAATDLDQVLETVPGIHVSRNAIEYAPSYLIRGIGSSGPTNPQVLVLQNGIPMTIMYYGDKSNEWAAYPLENVLRIEVIRGPGSALYGADAYSGVINIITRGPADTAGTHFTVGGGSFRTRDVSLRHGGKLGPIDVAAYLRVGKTDGLREIVTADAQTLNDSRFGTHVSRAPGPLNTGYDAIDANLELDYGKWRWRGNYVRRDNMHTGAGVNSALDPASTVDGERIVSDLSWTDPAFTQNWGLGAMLSYLHFQDINTRLQLFPPGTRLGPNFFPDGLIGGPSRWEKQLRLSAYATYAGFSGHSLRFGLGHDDLDMYKTSTLKNFLLPPVGAPIPTGPQIDYNAIQPHIRPQQRKVNYVYVQDEWQFARDWTLTAGVRHDDYSDFGGTTNPRLALVWDAALDVTVKLLYGEAFRAPAFNEQYSINPVADGNPKLRPETISTTEAAISWQARKDLQVNLNVFQYRMQDIIRIVPNVAPATGSLFNNIGAQKGHGMELELAWDASHDLRLSGNYSAQRGTDQASGQDAGYAPQDHFYGRADWRFAERWLLSWQLNWVSDRRRYRPLGDTRPDIADYRTVDLALRKSQGSWDIAVSVRNLFDADVREPSLAPGLTLPNDLPMAGRSYYLQASYKF